MASKKADFEGLRCQEFLTKRQAMAYTRRLTEKIFDEEILPYVHIYKGGKGGVFYLPELRKVVMRYIQISPLKTI